MGYVEIDPETGEETFTPDPNMPGGENDPTMVDIDGDGIPDHGLGVIDDPSSESPFPLDLPGQGGGDFDPFDTESMPKPWLTDPNWTPDSEPTNETPPVYEEGEFVDLMDQEQQRIDLM